MTRETNPLAPKGDSNGVWFRLRQNGSYVDVKSPDRDVGTTNPKLGWASLKWYTTHHIPARDFLVILGYDKHEHYHVYLNQSSEHPIGDKAIVDLDKYGLKSSDAIVIEEQEGYWFVVTGQDGENMDIKGISQEVDGDDPKLGWNPIPNDDDDDSPSSSFVSSRKIKEYICSKFDADPQDYKVYASQDTPVEEDFSDDSVIDFRNVGVEGNNPMMVKYDTTTKSNSFSDGDNNSDSGSDNGDVNTDPYVDFTRRLQNITTGDWSIYPESIPNTTNGEIMWTDGNASYSFASAPTIQAYKVVRRSPSVYNGSVTDVGLVSTSPYYFRLLD